MFENQYHHEMATEVSRLEAKARAAAAGHPEWLNACAGCGCRLEETAPDRCPSCACTDSGGRGE